MNSHPMNDRIEVMAMPPQEAVAREAEQRDAAAYVARRAQGDADRDLLMDILGLVVTRAGGTALAVTGLLLLALGHRISRGNP
ncbi:hypothetical protein ACIQV3_22390 [Streptomyces sp. NPDC099050]|uniref:hypothetical protein n=1 Tax=Streptomyces sp. NPDC099050 TaxID=3366100 RepID=UPI003814D1E3